LVLVEVRQANFTGKPYAISDLQVLQQDSTSFKVRNNHGEPGGGSRATIRWRAEGPLSHDLPAGTGTKPNQSPENSQTRQEQFIAHIKALGGTVTVDAQHPHGPVTGIDLHGSPVTDTDLEGFPDLPELRTLNLYGTRITDIGLQSVSSWSRLQTLYLNDTAVTDSGLQHLQSLRALQRLGLSQTQVSDEGLLKLRGLSQLTDLSLSGARITDQGILHLRDLHSLRHLMLSGTRVTAGGVEDLKRALPNIEVLH
jgi:Leucine-rich repeat (LRR) protein